MPRYSYLAKTLEGEPKSGVLEAKSQHELAGILRKEGCILVKATTKGEIVKKKKLIISLPFFDRVSSIEKIIFARNLRVMISAGISLPRSLKILAGQAKSKKFRDTLLDIENEIIKGRSFSSGLKKYPGVFSELFSSMVKVGEEAGTLEKVLDTLSRQMEKERDLKSKIKGAMVYPAVILFAMIGIGVVMMIMVVPKLAKTFEDLGVELPITTKVIIAVGSFLASFWYLLPIIFLTFLILLRMVLRTRAGKLIIDSFLLKIPIVAAIIKKTNSAHTARTLGSLIASGVPIVRSLEVLSGSLGNIHYKEAIAKVAIRVKEGAKLADALRDYQNIYPALVIQMIEIGEETGQTSDILQKLAGFFEEEVANTTKNLSAIIEPILMLIIGAAVGFFAIAMFQPIYSMMQTL